MIVFDEQIFNKYNTNQASPLFHRRITREPINSFTLKTQHQALQPGTKPEGQASRLSDPRHAPAAVAQTGDGAVLKSASKPSIKQQATQNPTLH